MAFAVRHGLRGFIVSSVLLLTLGGLAACAPKGEDEAQKERREHQIETADQFVDRLNKELKEIARETSAAGWVQNTYITTDTELLNARANERSLAYFSR